MNITLNTDPHDPLIATIEASDKGWYQADVYVVDRRLVPGIDSIIVEFDDVRIRLEEAKRLIERLQMAVEIAEREATRRYPYTRPGERPAADVVGLTQDV